MYLEDAKVIHTHTRARHEPIPVGERERAAAWDFYCDVLGGRQVWPFGAAGGNGRLWFLVAGVLIETGPGLRRARIRITVGAESAEDVAVRCWDAGFSVQVRNRGSGRASLALVDPFGQHIDLVPNDYDCDECA